MYYPITSFEGRIKSIFILVSGQKANPSTPCAETFKKKYKDLIPKIGTKGLEIWLGIGDSRTRAIFKISAEDFLNKIDEESDLSDWKEFKPVKNVFRANLEAINVLCKIVEVNSNAKWVPRRWTQDLFWVLQDPESKNPPKLLYSYKMSFDILKTIEAFAHESQLELIPIHLPFQGGNVLMGKDFMMIGLDHLEEYISASEETTHERAKKLFLEKFRMKGKELIVPGWESGKLPSIPNWGFPEGAIGGVNPKKHQLIYHLDLYLTLGGKAQNDKEKDLIFVAQFNLEDYVLNGNESIPRKELEVISSWLDEQATWLRNYPSNSPKKKFLVERIPLLYSHGSPGLASFNNCLIQVISDEERIALLPKYNLPGIAKWEKRIKFLFERHGFEVRWVEGDFTSGIKKGGSLHCLVKVLKRTSIF